MAVGVGPIEITDAVFSAGGLHGDFPGSFGCGSGIDFQSDKFSGEVLEIRIDVLTGMRFLAVNGDEVVARFHLQARFG